MQSVRFTSPTRAAFTLVMWALWLTVTAPVARAQFVTSATDLSGPARTISFAQFFAATTYLPLNVSADAAHPVFLTNTTPNEPGASQPVVSNAGYNLGGHFPDQPIFGDPVFCTNGTWDATRNGFVALYPGTIARFTFGGAPVRAVGAVMNYAPLCGTSDKRSPSLRLLGIDDIVIAEYDIDVLGRITTPNQLNAGAFRGAMRSQGDIFAVEFTGAFLVLDDLSYTLANDPTTPSTTTPEPSTMLLTAAGLSALARMARRRRRRA